MRDERLTYKKKTKKFDARTRFSGSAVKDVFFNYSDVQNLKHHLSLCHQAFNEAVNVESHVDIKHLVGMMGHVLDTTG